MSKGVEASRRRWQAMGLSEINRKRRCPTAVDVASESRPLVNAASGHPAVSVMLGAGGPRRLCAPERSASECPAPPTNCVRWRDRYADGLQPAPRIAQTSGARPADLTENRCMKMPAGPADHHPLNRHQTGRQKVEPARPCLTCSRQQRLFWKSNVGLALRTG